MKFTQVLYKQHLGRLTRLIWQVKRERKIPISNAEAKLSNLGFQVKEPSEIIDPKPIREKIQVEPPLKPKIIFDKIHPDWKAQTCLTFKDHNVPQEGIRQAQLLTNTICLSDGLSNYNEDSCPDLPEYTDDIVKRALYASNIFDAYQTKLPKRKDPDRPAWNFPRDYGISNARKMKHLSQKFIQLCESLSGADIMQKRCVVYDAITQLNLERESDLIQFTLKSDVMIMSSKPLKPIVKSISDVEIDLPNIYPLHYTVNFDQTNFYRVEDLYPVNTTSPWINVHTIFVYYDPDEIRNMTKLPVTQDQIISRAMIKSYTAAAFCARQRFGSSVKKLPEPVTVQCINMDGQHYHFFIYQLNSLDVNDLSTKNFWYTLPSLTLFQKAQYDNGMPVVEGYNPEVFRQILAFYRNGS